jgi:hypothetical protein
MYVHQPPYAAGANTVEIDLCTQKCQAAASAILFGINWQFVHVYQVFHVRRIFNRYNSHVWPEANPLAASVQWHQQHFAVNVWACIVCDFLIVPYLLPRCLSSHIYWMLLEKKLPETCGSSTTGLQLTLHIRSHHHLQRLLDCTRRACGLASQVTGLHTNGLLPIGPH